MVLIGLLAAWVAPASETWTCTFSPDEVDRSYTSTFVTGVDRVIETGLMSYGYEVLENNSDHLTFARSQYNAMLNAGFRLNQVAVVVTIDRRTDAVKKIFLQAHGERTDIQRGTCERIEV